jgi:hypothetical protein
MRDTHPRHSFRNDTTTIAILPELLDEERG